MDQAAAVDEAAALIESARQPRRTRIVARHLAIASEAEHRPPSHRIARQRGRDRESRQVEMFESQIWFDMRSNERPMPPRIDIRPSFVGSHAKLRARRERMLPAAPQSAFEIVVALDDVRALQPRTQIAAAAHDDVGHVAGSVVDVEEPFVAKAHVHAQVRFDLPVFLHERRYRLRAMEARELASRRRLSPDRYRGSPARAGCRRRSRTRC